MVVFTEKVELSSYEKVFKIEYIMLMQTEKMLPAWMTWFERRYKQYNDWGEEGEPKVMWMSGLQIPETFIAALVQSTCRAKGWPLDKSTVYTQVTPYVTVNDVSEKPKEGCYVTGLFLEGASWNEEKLMLRVQVQFKKLKLKLFSINFVVVIVFFNHMANKGCRNTYHLWGLRS